MNTSLAPRPGFDWRQVRWGGPKERRTEVCSYLPCAKPLGEDDIQLSLFRDDGRVAEFCVECQRTWWGLESFPE